MHHRIHRWDGLHSNTSRDLRDKWRTASEKGGKVDNAGFQTILMASLPESWNSVVVGLYLMTTSKDMIVALIVHWDQLAQQKKGRDLDNCLTIPEKPEEDSIGMCQPKLPTKWSCYQKLLLERGRKRRTVPSKLLKQSHVYPWTVSAACIVCN